MLFQIENKINLNFCWDRATRGELGHCALIVPIHPDCPCLPQLMVPKQMSTFKMKTNSAYLFGVFAHLSPLCLPDLLISVNLKFIVTLSEEARCLHFLAAYTRLYKPLCRSVRPSVGNAV